MKTRPALTLSPLMPLTRDFAFVVDAATPAGELVRPILAADKALIADARVFDVYQGAGVAEGMKSIAVEVTVQPQDKTLTDADIEALSAPHRGRRREGGRREAAQLTSAHPAG